MSMEERLRRLGPETTAPTIDDLERRTNRRRTTRHRLVAGATAAALVAVVAAAVVVTDDDDARPVTDVRTTDPAPTTSTQSHEPILNPELAENCIEEQGTFVIEGTENSRGYGVPPRVFAEAVSPMAVQIIGQHDQLPERYAVVLRLPDADLPEGQWGPQVDDSGAGDARIELDDGTALYLRSRGLRQEDLASLIASIEPRSTSAEVPGVDLAAASNLSVLAEADRLSGTRTTRSSCTLDVAGGTEAQIHVAVLAGEPVDVYTVALDRPSPLFIREQTDGSLLVLWGPSDLVDENMLDEVREAAYSTPAPIPTP